MFYSLSSKVMLMMSTNYGHGEIGDFFKRIRVIVGGVEGICSSCTRTCRQKPRTRERVVSPEIGNLYVKNILFC